MKTVTLHLLESGKGTVGEEACCLLASSCVSQECKVKHQICATLVMFCHVTLFIGLARSLCWSLLLPRISVLQFSCNKIAREKREGLIWPNWSIWLKMPGFLRNKEVKTCPILQFSQITLFDALFNKIICCWLKHSLTCNYSYLLQNRKC